MPFVDRDFINDLPNRVDIVGLINKRVALKKLVKIIKHAVLFMKKNTFLHCSPTKQIYIVLVVVKRGIIDLL
jgi:DNA primase (bacterial type)